MEPRLRLRQHAAAGTLSATIGQYLEKPGSLAGAEPHPHDTIDSLRPDTGPKVNKSMRQECGSFSLVNEVAGRDGPFSSNRRSAVNWAELWAKGAETTRNL
jgi:hypothetical protein